MQGKVRVLIVDDAVVVRRMLADILDSDPELEVVGTAANGKAALEKMPQVEPQVSHSRHRYARNEWHRDSD